MSAITEAQEAAAPFDNDTPAVHVTRHFKTTKENKTEVISILLNEQVSEFLVDTSLRSARWRSFGQMVNDAIIFYLNSESGEKSPREIIGEATWSYEQKKGAAITKTLFDEIDLMVSQFHTPWDTKQEFYICALFCYVNAGFPPVERR